MGEESCENGEVLSQIEIETEDANLLTKVSPEKTKSLKIEIQEFAPHLEEKVSSVEKIPPKVA